MNEKLQNILKEIDNGTRKSISDLNLTKEEFLAKDSNGICFFEYLLQKNIYIKYDKLENDATICYLLCKYDKNLYSYNLDESTLFSYVNGTRLIDYIIEKNKITSNIVRVITKNTEIIDLLIKSNNIYNLDSVSDEIKNKLTEKDYNGSYLIEKYLDKPKALSRLIPFINDFNKLLEICIKNNNYDLMKYVNKNVLMSKINDTTVLEYLINTKNIVPKILNNIPDNKDFIIFLIEHNYHNFLLNTNESALLTEIFPSKTLLEYLIEKGYSPNVEYVFEKETIAILDKYNKLDSIKNLSKNLLLEKIFNILQNNSSDETLLEYLLDRNYDFSTILFYNRSIDILKILYKKGRLDLLASSDIEALLSPIEENGLYTYFDVLLEGIKNDKVRAKIKLSYSTKDINVIVKFYLALANHDMMEYVDELNKEQLLKKYGNTTLLEELLNANSDLTLNKIIKNSVKSDPEIAFIIKSKGYEQENINIANKVDNFAEDYLNGIIKHSGIGPLYEEGEVLLTELKTLFTSDGRSDEGLINALVSGYRRALMADYDTNIQELKNLVEIKKKNISKFCYIKEENSGYFSPRDGSVFCDNNVIDTILHETGHALHYYLTDNNVPDNYKEIINRAKGNEELLIKTEKIAYKYKELKNKIIKLVEAKYNKTFEDYYDEDKIREIQEIVAESKEEIKKKYKDLNIPKEQLDIILNNMYTTDEYINHQKRIFIGESADALLRSELGNTYAICDILDAIYEGKLHSGQLFNSNDEKISTTPGHGISYYYETHHGFDEIIANFSAIAKSKDSKKDLLLLKEIVGDEVYDMISNFYYNNIVYIKNDEFDISSTKKGR